MSRDLKNVSHVNMQGRGDLWIESTADTKVLSQELVGCVQGIARNLERLWGWGGDWRKAGEQKMRSEANSHRTMQAAGLYSE